MLFQKSDNDPNLMVGVCLSIKNNSLTGRNISLFTVFDLSSPLKVCGIRVSFFLSAILAGCYAQFFYGPVDLISHGWTALNYLSYSWVIPCKMSKFSKKWLLTVLQTS